MRASSGSSLKDKSWAISARVLTLNIPILLMTIGIILMSGFLGVVGLENLFEWFVDGIDMVYDLLHVPIREVLALNEL